MNRSDRRRFGVGAIVSVVPEMRPGATKRNLAVGLGYLLVVWVVVAHLLSAVAGP